MESRWPVLHTVIVQFLLAVAARVATATTYRWPSSWCFAALRGFIQPVVDAARHACLHHSCFLFEQSQRSARPGRHLQQGRAGSANELVSFLSLSLFAPVTHTKFHQLSSTHTDCYLERVPAAPGWAEHAASLPHALDVSYAVSDHGQIHRSGARGSRLLVLSLQRQGGGLELGNSRERNMLDTTEEEGKTKYEGDTWRASWNRTEAGYVWANIGPEWLQKVLLFTYRHWNPTA